MFLIVCREKKDDGSLREKEKLSKRKTTDDEQYTFLKFMDKNKNACRSIIDNGEYERKKDKIVCESSTNKR